MSSYSTATTVNSLLGTDVSAPSAEALPFILRQKLRRQLHRLGKSDPYASLALTAEKKVPAEDRPRLYTADELETQLQQVSAAIVSTQQQIQASEETYYEETYAHGSVFAGWDGFIDSREVGANLAAAAPQRRMPQDSRWFSSSSSSNNNNSQRQETPHLPVQLVEEGRPVTFQVEEAMVTEKAATTATAQSAAVEPPTDEAKNNDDETDEPNADDAMKMGPEDTTYNEKDAEKEEEAEEQAEKEQEDVKKDETKKDVKASKRKAAVTVEPTRTTRPKRAKRG
jgi:hypothetical protein